MSVGDKLWLILVVGLPALVCVVVYGYILIGWGR